MTGSCEHDDESLGSMKGEEFLDKLSSYQLLMMDSALCNLLLLLVMIPLED